MPNLQVLSFWSEIFKRLFGETYVFGRTFIFCIFLCNGGTLNLLRHVVDLSVSVIDHVTTGWDYVIVEHVKTWLLNSGFAKSQRFWSEFHFSSSFVQFNSYCIRGPCSIDPFGLLVFRWVFWKVLNFVSVLFLSEIFKLFSR